MAAKGVIVRRLNAIENLDRMYLPSAPQLFGYNYRMVARNAKNREPRQVQGKRTKGEPRAGLNRGFTGL